MGSSVTPRVKNTVSFAETVAPNTKYPAVANDVFVLMQSRYVAGEAEVLQIAIVETTVEVAAVADAE